MRMVEDRYYSCSIRSALSLLLYQGGKHMSDAKDDIYLKLCNVHVFVFDWYSFPGSSNVLSFWIKFVMIRFHCLILIKFGDGYIQVKKKKMCIWEVTRVTASVIYTWLLSTCQLYRKYRTSFIKCLSFFRKINIYNIT